MDPDQLASLTPEQLAAMPAGVSPTGVYNFDHPYSIAPRAIATISVFLAIMILIVALRLYSRLIVARKTGLDDWAAVAGAIFTTGLAGTALYQLSQNWFGPHMWDIHLTVFLSPAYNSLIFVLTIMLMPASFFVKVSVLLFLARIFPRRAAPKTTYAIWTGLAINAVAYSALIIYIGVSCAPRPADRGMLPLQCTAKVRQDQGVASAVINAAMDLYVLGIAIPAVWSLQLVTRKKIGIVGVFAMGIIACAFSFATLYYRVGTDGAVDPSYNQTVPLIFTVLEPIFGTITACLPAIPALWVEISAKARSSIRSLLSRFRGSTSKLGTSTYDKGGYESHYSKSGYEMHSRSVARSHASSRNETHGNGMAMNDIEQLPIVAHAFPSETYHNSQKEAFG